MILSQFEHQILQMDDICDILGMIKQVRCENPSSSLTLTSKQLTESTQSSRKQTAKKLPNTDTKKITFRGGSLQSRNIRYSDGISPENFSDTSLDDALPEKSHQILKIKQLSNY
jgi:hypothetical protein